jgi:hypothetical protein
MSRDWTAFPAVREQLPLLIGLSGAPGSGKTYSALTLAQGIKSHRGGSIILLDTDGDRARAYAPRKGEVANGVTSFDFEHLSFAPPYGPDDFLAAIQAQLPRNPACIIVDALSAEHEGEGGVLWLHDTELDRMAGDDWKKRDVMTTTAWIKPKAARRRLINFLMKMKVPIIATFQAREKTKLIQNDRGKMAPTNIGWTPIAPSEIIQSMTLFCLLPIRSDGVPMWKGNTAHEDFTIKLPVQFKHLFPDSQPLNQSMGAAMSRWAAGDDAKAAPASPPPPPPPPAAASNTQPTSESTGSWDYAAWQKASTEVLAGITTVADLDAWRGDESNKECFGKLTAADPALAKSLSAAIQGRRKALLDKETEPQF